MMDYNENNDYVSWHEAYAKYRDAGIGARKGSLRAFLFHPYTVWMTATFYMTLGTLFAVTAIMLDFTSFFAIFCLVTFAISFLHLVFSGFRLPTLWHLFVKGFLGVLGIVLLQDLLWHACGIRWFTRPMAYGLIFFSAANYARVFYVTNVVAQRVQLLESGELRNAGEILILVPNRFLKIEKFDS